MKKRWTKPWWEMGAGCIIVCIIFWCMWIYYDILCTNVILNSINLSHPLTCDGDSNGMQWAMTYFDDPWWSLMILDDPLSEKKQIHSCRSCGVFEFLRVFFFSSFTAASTTVPDQRPTDEADWVLIVRMPEYIEKWLIPFQRTHWPD